MTVPMSDVEAALKALTEGRPVLVYDADGREEETDIVFYSSLVGSDEVRLLRKHGGGLICITVAHEVAKALGMPFLVDVFRAAKSEFPLLGRALPDSLPYDTKSAFSLTFNHRKCYTGITDRDRAMTVSGFGRFVEEVEKGEHPDPAGAFASAFRIPGHVFLLRTSERLLEDRNGHTELSTALCLMAGLAPTATICEMMGDDGNALPKAKAREFAHERNLTFLEGEEIIWRWRDWSG
jgi:3,4-dihydroxy 2-butanone 4-phosphate synthase